MRISKKILTVCVATSCMLAASTPQVARAYSTENGVADETQISLNSEGQQYMMLTEEDIELANRVAREHGEAPLPEAVRSVIIDDGVYIPADQEGMPVPMPRGFWGTSWRIAKCVAAIGSAMVPGTRLASIIRRSGGIGNVARRLVESRNFNEFRQTFGDGANLILGIDDVRENCFGG